MRMLPSADSLLHPRRMSDQSSTAVAAERRRRPRAVFDSAVDLLMSGSNTSMSLLCRWPSLAAKIVPPPRGGAISRIERAAILLEPNQVGVLDKLRGCATGP